MYVDADAFGANDGTSWLDAFNDLQRGLDFAADPANGVTEIWVAEGVYVPDRESGDPEATFEIVSGVLMYGGFAGEETRLGERDPALHETILSGDLLGDDAPTGVYGTNPCCNGFPPTGCDDPACAQAVCENWPYTCCDGNWTQDCPIKALTICCDLCGNRCDNSHHVVTASGTNESTLLDGFTITGGRPIGLGYPGGGGGILNVGGNLTVNHCRIVGNTGNTGGGGMTNWVYANGAVSNSVFIGNSSPIGGGMLNANSSPAVTNCAFFQNLGAMGGGMENMEYSARPVVTNCIFSGNAAGIGGGVHSLWKGLSPLINCVLIGNAAYERGGGVFVNSGELPITNSILWQNTDVSGNGEDSQVVGGAIIDFSCVQGWTGALGGVSNSGDDPLFLDADGADDVPGTEDDDLHLLPTSPYLDAGNNIAVPHEVTTDFDGRGRFVELPDIPDTGNGFSPIVDLGIYEHGSDCNGNGIADEGDIASGTSTDCNTNAIPDECEPTEDCNMNGIPDECDDDCNGTGTPDDCDLASGTSADDNGNGIPDECEAPKNRFISFLRDLSTDTLAYRVTLTSSFEFPESTGQGWWV
ncbi:MAG: hypothetical protein ACYTFA_05030, partial [Planctomycetota bacterium]